MLNVSELVARSLVRKRQIRGATTRRQRGVKPRMAPAGPIR